MRTEKNILGAFLLALCLAAGCGRVTLFPERDAGRAPGHDGAAGSSGDGAAGASGDGAADPPPDRTDGPPARDILVVDLGRDLPVDQGRDTIVQPPPDAPPDRPDTGAVDMNSKPDLGPPDVGQDLVSDRRPDTGPDADANCGSPYDIYHCGSCTHDCTALPNVQVGALYCYSGTCYVNGCAPGFAQCPFRQLDRGCETDLRSDTQNCGGCGIVCGLRPGSPGICKNGACVGECPDGYGDCTDELGCETPLNTPDNCGACGRPACQLANTVALCSVSNVSSSCDEALCARGYGNCETSKPDCEASMGSPGGTCFPKYKGTIWIPTNQSDMALAVGSDGSPFIGGRFYGSAIDFDFTDSGVDLRNASSNGTPFVTKATADGGYAWTRTFVTTGDSDVVGLAGTADGGVIVAGFFQGIIDLDPGAGTDYHTALAQTVFVVKLAGDGSFVWGRALQGLSTDASSYIVSLATASDGSIYVGGGFTGQVDFDPGAGVVARQSPGYTGTTAILKLGGDGAFGWVDTWDITFTPSCQIGLGQLAVAPDGAVWAVGSFTGPCDMDPGTGFDLRQSTSYNSNGLLFALNAAGGYPGTWSFDARDVQSGYGYGAGVGGGSIVIDDQGAVHVAGSFAGTVDFDPGPGEVLRTAAGSASFVAGLSDVGAYQQVKVESAISPSAIALGPGGSVLVAGSFSTGYSAGGIFEVPADQSLGWTIAFGDYSTYVNHLVSTSQGFFVGGTSYGSGDYDPGPDFDIFSGTGVYVSRYAY